MRGIYDDSVQEQAPITLSALRERLWHEARQHAEEVALAAHALFGAPPGDDQWPELLDFVGTEWVDARGWVGHQRLGLGLHDWLDGVRTSLWTVDGWEGELVCLRDAATDEEIAVSCPGAEADLPRRTVLRARVVPWDGALRFLGEPALFGQHGVIGRMQLLEAWRDSPEPATLSAQRELRLGFARQRDQRQAFLAYFGEDRWTAASADELERGLNAFLAHYLYERPCPLDGGRPPVVAARAKSGREPQRVELRLGDSLRGGPPSVVFDEVFGLEFVPAGDAPLSPVAGRAAPSSLPGFEDDAA